MNSYDEYHKLCQPYERRKALFDAGQLNDPTHDQPIEFSDGDEKKPSSFGTLILSIVAVWSTVLYELIF